MPITGQDMIDAVLHPTLQACNNTGITLDRLLKDLKKELKAKETKFLKVKRNLTAEQVMREIRGMIDGEYEGNRITKARVVYRTSDEVVIAVDMIAWGVRQAARKDAHMLRGDYPAKNVEITGKGGGPIPVTNYPPTAASLDDWQQQMEAAEKNRLDRQSREDQQGPLK